MKSHPGLPRIYEIAAAARPRPVTPYYLMLSTTLQPEFSAVLAGVETPRQAVERARRRIEHFLQAVR